MHRSTLIQFVLEYLPGIRTLLPNRLADLPDDLHAGLTVAAIALPISFANTQIAGFGPIVGLYALLLPMAAGDPHLCAALAITLGLMVGVICPVASLMQLGGIADFRSRPILMGFLHGIAIALILDLIPVSQIDVTGWHTLIELTRELDVEGIRLSFAGRQSEMPDFAQRERIDDEFLSGRNYLTIELVVTAFQTEFGKPKEDASEKRLRIEPEVPA